MERPIKMVYPNIYEQPAFMPRIKSDTS